MIKKVLAFITSEEGNAPISLILIVIISALLLASISSGIKTPGFQNNFKIMGGGPLGK